EDDAELARLQARAQSHAVDGVSADLAKVAHHASTGEGDWSDLRATKLGWAPSPLWSYADLEIRLPAREKPGDPAPVDQNGDGIPDPVLDRYVDQNRDGRPDLLVTENTVDVGRVLRIPAQFQIV